MGAENAAIILCPGPSLNSAIEALSAGDIAAPMFTVGVNRAVEAYPCDYWCALDAGTYDKFEPLGNPRYIIRWDQERKLEPETVADLEREETIRKKMDGWPRGIDYISYSVLGAVAFSVSRDAERVDIYGADMDGVEDWDGRLCPKCRNEKRWCRERQKFEKLREYYDGKGIEVRRVFTGMI